jgi:hypothetical protein
MIFLGFLLTLMAPAAAPVPAAPSPVPASQCRAGEKIVYTCGFGKSVGSICANGGKLHYRYGPAGRPAIDIASDAKWSNVRRGFIVGGGGGSQRHLRFTRDGHSYVVFWGVGGQYTQVPGKTWSGIHVSEGKTDLATLRCKRAASPSDDWEDLAYDAPEEDDPQFEMWF